MRQYEQYLEHFSDLPGWFERPAIALWDSLLAFQERSGHRGNLLEIGVWKGKSAALMALHCEVNESCVFVDIFPTDDARARISEAVPNATCTYIRRPSQYLMHEPRICELGGKVRWVHIDGEHTSEAVISDLAIADFLLERKGLVIVDDFFTPAYPQVTSAVFHFLMTHPGSFRIVLCGFNKGYLCRPLAARSYLEFMKDCLWTEMSSRGFGEITLWKTTDPNDMNTFGITDRYLDMKYRGPDKDPNCIVI